MKKGLIITASVILGLVVLLAIIPLFFKPQMLNKVKTIINENVNAKVEFADFNLSLLKGFPNLYVALDDLSVSGINEFEGDTLLTLHQFSVKVDILSLFGNEGIGIKSIMIDRPVIKAKVLQNGKANWDIAKTDTTAVEQAADTSKSNFKIKLTRFEIRNADIMFTDLSSDLAASIKNFNFVLKGDLGADRSVLDIQSKTEAINVAMSGIRYLKDASLLLDVNVDADLKNAIYTFKDNEIALNALSLGFTGSVAMPDTNIVADVNFATKKTDFKSVLSLVPAVYMSGFENVKTSGEFKLAGYVKGTYNAVQTPNADISFEVDKARFQYPDLPKSVENISIMLKAFWDGVNNDNSTLDVSKFHFEMAGNPFDFTTSVRTPMSDPDVKATAKGTIDFASLTDVIPMDSVSIKGILNANIDLAGKVSMIEKEQYEQFKADGTLGLTNFSMNSADFPAGVVITAANMQFSPKFVELSQFDSKVGKSDFSLKGRLENFVPYIFSDGTIKGKLALVSNVIDVNEFMSPSAEPAAETTDTSALSVVEVPKNIQFNFTADIKKMYYDNLDISNTKGEIVVSESKVMLNNLAMELLQGAMKLSGEYNTQDISKPSVAMDMKISNFDIPSAFSAFSTLAGYAPYMKNAKGKFSMDLMYTSLLDQQMSPILNSVNGKGTFGSSEFGINSTATLKKLGDALKTDKLNNPTLRNINVAFEIKDGRIFLSPFDIAMGKSKVNVSGDQGLDQTMNYIMKMQLPRSELGAGFNNVVSGLVSGAASKGVNINPGETVNVNAIVSGTTTDPKISLGFDESLSSLKDQVKQQVVEKIKEVKEEAVTKVKEEASKRAEQILAEAEKQAALIKQQANDLAKKTREEAEIAAAKIEKQGADNPLKKMAAKKSADVVRKEADNKAKQIIAEADNKATQILKSARIEADKLK